MNEMEKFIEYLKKENKYKYEIIDRDETDDDGEFCKGVQVRIKEPEFTAIWCNGAYGYEEGFIEVLVRGCRYSRNYIFGCLTCENCINILNNYELLTELTKKREEEVEKATKKIEHSFDKQISEIIKDENWYKILYQQT